MTNKENLEEDEEPVKLKQTLKEIEAWRKFGPIGKLHNIVVDIQSSAQKIQEFMVLMSEYQTFGFHYCCLFTISHSLSHFIISIVLMPT